jgi:hypothetical protein
MGVKLIQIVLTSNDFGLTFILPSFLFEILHANSDNIRVDDWIPNSIDQFSTVFRIVSIGWKEGLINLSAFSKCLLCY